MASDLCFVLKNLLKQFCVVQAGVTLQLIHQPQLLQYWDFSYAPPFPDLCSFKVISMISATFIVKVKASYQFCSLLGQQYMQRRDEFQLTLCWVFCLYIMVYDFVLYCVCARTHVHTYAWIFCLFKKFCFFFLSKKREKKNPEVGWRGNCHQNILSVKEFSEIIQPIHKILPTKVKDAAHKIPWLSSITKYFPLYLSIHSTKFWSLKFQPKRKKIKLNSFCNIPQYSSHENKRERVS